jgi:hypothetical protein
MSADKPTRRPRNMRNSVSRPQVSRSRCANSFNHFHNLSAVAGHRATILQPHSTVDGGQAMTVRVPSAIATTNRRLRRLLESSPSLHQSSPELHQPLRGFIQRFLGLSQSLPDPYQSPKEANQSLQESQNQIFGISQPKNCFGRSFYHRRDAETWRFKIMLAVCQDLCAFAPLRLNSNS